jgi:hypothetical protein
MQFQKLFVDGVVGGVVVVDGVVVGDVVVGDVFSPSYCGPFLSNVC